MSSNTHADGNPRELDSAVACAKARAALVALAAISLQVKESLGAWDAADEFASRAEAVATFRERTAERAELQASRSEVQGAVAALDRARFLLGGPALILVESMVTVLDLLNDVVGTDIDLFAALGQASDKRSEGQDSTGPTD